MSVKWHLTVVLVFISLIANEVEHLLMWILAICDPSFMKCLFMSSAYLPVELFGVFSLLLICSPLYTNLLSIIRTTKYLLPMCSLSFHFF